MTQSCDCCAGSVHVGKSTISNRPNLNRVSFRLGKHGWFFSTMLSRLSPADFTVLNDLRTRDNSDFSIAYLDACAIVSDVLCFYQERTINEGFLRTATERRSLVELSRLVGYSPRPGVSASTYLAYTLEKDSRTAIIPVGSKSNTVPGPGEDMQAFETSEPLLAREEWNAIRPRLRMPQNAKSIFLEGLYIRGSNVAIKRGDRILLHRLDQNLLMQVVDYQSNEVENYTFAELKGASPDAEKEIFFALAQDLLASQSAELAAEHIDTSFLFDQQTASGETRPSGVLEKLDELLSENGSAFAIKLMTDLKYLASKTLGGYISEQAGDAKFESLSRTVEALKKSPAMTPENARTLAQNVDTVYGAQHEVIPRVLAHLLPAISSNLYAAWKNFPPERELDFEVYILRSEARPFGHNAPLRLFKIGQETSPPEFKEWLVKDPWNEMRGTDGTVTAEEFHQAGKLYLDNDFEIASDDLIVLQKSDNAYEVITAESTSNLTIAAYGLAGKTTRIIFKGSEWLGEQENNFSSVRQTRVFLGKEKLELAERPIKDPICGKQFELDGLYEGLEAGRWVIVNGERADIQNGRSDSLKGVFASELVMVESVEQYTSRKEVKTGDNEVSYEAIAGETVHSKITLALQGLAYCYRRESVTINANVVKATHGETRVEVLGSGSAAHAFQNFGLKQRPLTHTSAASASGAETSLEVLVNGVAWHEKASLAIESKNSRSFVTRTDDDNQTVVMFGNGKHGLRLPTGRENITAKYRNGIGRPGNVKAGQISLLATRPLGVNDVVNPVKASGGADREGMACIRRNAPASVVAFDRLVSVSDYADFAGRFAGVSKALAVSVSSKTGSQIAVTIAGDADDPIDRNSDLMRNLSKAFVAFGDEDVNVKLMPRQKLAIIISANVKLSPDYRWDSVEPTIRAALLEKLGFENAVLNGAIFRSAVIAAIQAVEGVDYCDIDVFDELDEEKITESFVGGPEGAIKLKSKKVISLPETTPSAVPAKLAYLTPTIPETLILQEIKS